MDSWSKHHQLARAQQYLFSGRLSDAFMRIHVFKENWSARTMHLASLTLHLLHHALYIALCCTFVEIFHMRLILLTLCLFSSVLLTAQSPALIPYQAIARDAEGQPIVNSSVSARFTIHDIAIDGEVVWQEVQTTNTGSTGLIIVQLGSNVSLANVNWAAGAKFLQMEIDLGSGFVDIGSQQMMSVPYALHAASVRLDISETGDTLFVGDDSFIIAPGVSYANNDGAQDLTSVVIGNQEWMNKNLSVATYSDGTPIPQVKSVAQWSTLTTGAWCWFANDSASYSTNYGRLYNWYAVAGIYDEASANDPLLRKQLAPEGWHVATDEEWNAMINFLDPTADGGNFDGNVAGGKMKSTGTIQNGTGVWNTPNTQATNLSGFSGFAGGSRGANGSFGNIGNRGYWWTATASNSTNAWGRNLIYNGAEAGKFGYFFREGFSVRCVRD
jgi:uncharacterized protein (TIGR02145 family)